MRQECARAHCPAALSPYPVLQVKSRRKTACHLKALGAKTRSKCSQNSTRASKLGPCHAITKLYSSPKLGYNQLILNFPLHGFAWREAVLEIHVLSVRRLFAGQCFRDSARRWTRLCNVSQLCSILNNGFGLSLSLVFENLPLPQESGEAPPPIEESVLANFHHKRSAKTCMLSRPYLDS